MVKDKDKLQEDREIEQITGIDTCLGCNKAIVHTIGKRKRKWCSDACRVATGRRSNPNINNEQTITEQPITNKPERTALGNIRVSKPGDDDYVPMCETTRRFLARTSPVLDELNPSGIKEPPYDINVPIQDEPKRGKDIKTFADLPPDVQATINKLSQSNEEKQKRTKAAIHWQHNSITSEEKIELDRRASHKIDLGRAGNVPTGYLGTPNLGQAQTADIGESR